MCACGHLDFLDQPTESIKINEINFVQLADLADFV